MDATIWECDYHERVYMWMNKVSWLMSFKESKIDSMNDWAQCTLQGKIKSEEFPCQAGLTIIG